jgi:hypothetical protein
MAKMVKQSVLFMTEILLASQALPRAHESVHRTIFFSFVLRDLRV